MRDLFKREGKSREREGRAFPFFPKSEGRPPTLARNSRLPGSLQECRRLRSTPSRMSWAPCAPRVGRIFLLVLSSQMKWICSFAKVGIALLGSCRTKSLSHQQNKIMRKSVGRTLERKGPCQQEESGGISFFLSNRKAVRMGSLQIKICRAIPYTERMLRILHSSVKSGHGWVGSTLSVMRISSRGCFWALFAEEMEKISSWLPDGTGTTLDLSWVPHVI